MLQIVKTTDAVGLDRRARRVIDSLPALANFSKLSAATARKTYASSRTPYLWPLDEVAEIVDIAAAGDVPPLRLFRPALRGAVGPAETYLFLHGGGWTVGDLATYEPLCRRLAHVLRADILWVDYRLAPEHPFPAPLDDTLAACRWIFANAASLGLDATRIGLIGDSSGGNLAAVAALLNRRGELGEKFAAQVLIYPCLDLTRSHPSHQDFADGFLLTGALYRWYVENYLRDRDSEDPLVSPLLADDLAGAAPAVIVHAGFNPLRDEAIAYVGKLRRAGVVAKEIAFADMIHGFLTMGGVLPQAGDALACIRAALEALPPDSGS